MRAGSYIQLSCPTELKLDTAESKLIYIQQMHQAPPKPILQQNNSIDELMDKREKKIGFRLTNH